MVARAGQPSPSRTMYSRESPQCTRGGSALQHCCHQRGARVSIMPFLRRVAQDLVGGEQRAREEFLHILELGLGLALEQAEMVCSAICARHLALGMAAHAVGQHKQTRLAGVAIPAVFVLFAAAAARRSGKPRISFHANKGCAQASS